jgi:hypothetical protein
VANFREEPDCRGDFVGDWGWVDFKAPLLGGVGGGFLKSRKPKDGRQKIKF